jgi:hypothetical protein
MTDTVSMLEVCRQLSDQLAAFEALLLGVSGMHKVIGRQRARVAAHELAGVPSGLAPVAVAVLAGVELIAGLLLCIPRSRAAGAALAVLIWGGYSGLLLRAVAQGRREVDCGCSFGPAHRSLGAFQISRSAALAAMAVLVAVVGATGGAGYITVTQILAAVTLLALYAALDQAMALEPPRAGELL